MWIALVLVLSATAVAHSVSLFRRARTHGNSLADPAVTPKDLRALAWLRGGNSNLVLLTTYELIRSGNLCVVEKNGKPTNRISRTDQVPDFHRLDPLQTAILLAFDKPRTLANLLTLDAVLQRAREAGEEVQEGLVAVGLAVPGPENARRGWTLAGHGAALAAAVTFAILFTPMSDGLILLLLAAAVVSLCVAAAFSTPIRLTTDGRKLLTANERELDGARLRLLYPVQGEVEFARLRATYGWNVSLGAEEGSMAKPFEGMDDWTS